MLVLTRKRSETIRIGEDVVIKVIRTGRNAVKIGIQAPANVRVLRGELCFEHANAKTPAVEAVPVSDEEDEDAELVLACSDQFPHPHAF